MAHGGPKPEKNWFQSYVPDDLKHFDSSDIERAFNCLEHWFKISKRWRAEYKEQVRIAGGRISECEIFFQLAKGRIEPALKTLTKRDDSVIEAMCRWLKKDALLEMRRGEFLDAKNLKRF